MSTLRMSRAAIPHLEAQGGGSITNIVSISVKQPIPNLVLSNTARTAVIGLARSLALELAPKGIRVNNVCPGSILTDRIRSIAAGTAEKSGEVIDDVIAREGAAIPIGRHGEPGGVRPGRDVPRLAGSLLRHRRHAPGRRRSVQGTPVTAAARRIMSGVSICLRGLVWQDRAW